MAIPIRNTVFDKINEAKRLTDVELFKSLVKMDMQLQMIDLTKFF